MTPNNDIELDTVAPYGGGLIGLTPCPGIGVGGLAGRPEERIDADLAALRTWGAAHLVTLMQDPELVALQGGHLGALARRHFGERGWHHLPIPDGGIPDRRWEHAWSELSGELHDCLTRGGRVAVHCLAGIGRTGLVTCRLLIERGEPRDEAIRRVRQARPGTVESLAQEHYVMALRSGPLDP